MCIDLTDVDIAVFCGWVQITIRERPGLANGKRTFPKAANLPISTSRVVGWLQRGRFLLY